MRRAGIFLLAAALLSALVPARADTATRRDPRDTTGRFDIRAVSHGHSADGRIIHTIRTHGRWKWHRARCFNTSSKCRAFFRIYFFTDRDTSEDRYLDVYRRDGKTYSTMYRWRPSCFSPTGVCIGEEPEQVARPKTHKPTARSVRVAFWPRALGRNVDSYEWQAYVVFWRKAECKNDSSSGPNGGFFCWDNAPDVGSKRITHRL